MFEWFGNLFDGAITGFTGGAIARINTWVSGLTASILGIWFLNFGWAVLRREVQEPVQTTFKKVLMNVVLVALATRNAIYKEWVVDLFSGLQLDMARAFAPAGSPLQSAANIWSAIDAYGNQTGQLMNSIFTSTIFSLSALAGGFAVFLFAAGSLIFMIVSLCAVAYTKVVMAFLAVIGPIFILAAVFESTRKWAWNFVGAMLGAVVLMWFFFFALGLTLSINLQVATAATAGVGGMNLIAQSMAYCAIVVAMAAALWSAPSFVSGLVGGPPMQVGLNMVTQVMTMVRSGRGSGPQQPGADNNAVGSRGGLAYRAGSALGQATGLQYAYQRIARRGRS